MAAMVPSRGLAVAWRRDKVRAPTRPSSPSDQPSLPPRPPTLSLDQDAGEHRPGLYQAALTTTDPLTTCPRAPPPPHPASPGVSLCVERRLARRTPDRQPGLVALLVQDQGSCSHPRCAGPLSPRGRVGDPLLGPSGAAPRSSPCLRLTPTGYPHSRHGPARHHRRVARPLPTQLALPQL